MGEKQEARVKKGLAWDFTCDPRAEMPLSVWDDQENTTISVKRYMESCKDGSINFLKCTSHPQNLWYQIEDGDYGMMYHFAGGVELQDEDPGPTQLPTYYVFQWAKIG